MEKKKKRHGFEGRKINKSSARRKEAEQKPPVGVLGGGGMWRVVNLFKKPPSFGGKPAGDYSVADMAVSRARF